MMTESELIERDAKRDLGAELLQSIQQMKAGQKAVVHKIDVSYVVEARQKVGFTQEQFATLLGVSKRTLQEWEQGRRTPSGAANSLLKIAIQRPEILREVFHH
jgi:putative transcriptional regulator